MKKFFYRVSVEDTVFSVARAQKVPLTVLINQNSLTQEISAGDLLYIESEKEPYIVQPFDTFNSISKRLGVEEAKLRADNGVDYIFYGLSLKV